jgi:hypothetical protein
MMAPGFTGTVEVGLAMPLRAPRRSISFTVAVRSGVSQMPLVVVAPGSRLVTSPPLRPGQHLVGDLS